MGGPSSFHLKIPFPDTFCQLEDSNAYRTEMLQRPLVGMHAECWGGAPLEGGGGLGGEEELRGSPSGPPQSIEGGGPTERLLPTHWCGFLGSAINHDWRDLI